MAALTRSFRSWWRRPRRASEPQDRTVSFLELFYDLVYVVLVAELAHALASHVDWKGVGAFAFLFAIVWWSWHNGSLYHDLHGHNDIRTRIFTYLQMFAVAAMAVFAHNALSSGSVGFALSYAAFQLILTYLWWRTGVHDPEHRVLSNPYALAFLITTIMFLISVFVPAPLRFYLWGIAVFINLFQPLRQLIMQDERAKRQFERSIVTLSPALVERFGLFTILVLAEVIVGVVQGLAASDQLNAPAGWAAGLGMIIACAFWGLYFDYVSHRRPVAKRVQVISWLYLHLFVTISITATGAAVLNVVQHASEGLESNVRWLLVGSIAMFLLSLVPLMQIIQVPVDQKRLYRVAGVFTFVSAVAVALLGLTPLSSMPLLIIIVALMLITVLYGFMVWVKVFGAGDIAPH
jgi:low temperature requirement protein LtrA